MWNLFENFKDFNSSRRSCVIEHEHGSCGTVAPIIRSVPEMRELLDHHRATGQTIGLIGTSGGLHEGHLSLVRRSVEANDITVLWLFTGSSGLVEAGTVPAYVRNYERDQRAALDAGATFVFCPPNETLFAFGAPLVRVQVDPVLAEPWMGSDSAAFVNMTATMLAKAINIVGPCRLYCGEKDWQNAAVLTRMVSDLSMAATVVTCASVREPDGLVLGSRNVKLSPSERARAPGIKRALDAAVRAIESGQDDPSVIESALRADLAAVGTVEYAVVVAADTLKRVSPLVGDLRILVSVGFSDVSLLDNAAARIGISQS